MKNKKISGAEAVIHCLLNEGVDLVWGYPGGAIMPVYDEFYKFQDKLKHVLARHEQGNRRPPRKSITNWSNCSFQIM